jgi:hypothetical protein
MAMGDTWVDGDSYEFRNVCELVRDIPGDMPLDEMDDRLDGEAPGD